MSERQRKGSAGAGKAPAERGEDTGIVIRDRRKIRKDDPARVTRSGTHPRQQDQDTDVVQRKQASGQRTAPPDDPASAMAGDAAEDTVVEPTGDTVEPTEVLPPAGGPTDADGATGMAAEKGPADTEPRKAAQKTTRKTTEPGTATAADAPDRGATRERAERESPGTPADTTHPAGPETAAAQTVKPEAETVKPEAETVETEAETVEAEEAAGAPIGDELGVLGAELAGLRSELDERLRDLQRVTAEYANYRKRVERDRALVSEQATGSVLAALLPTLDDLDRAREHGDLVGPFGSVADQMVAALTKFGLTPFGEKGDPFDPTRHEAVAHLTSAEVTEPSCVDILRRGYLLGSRLLRPALVAVADPE